MEPIRAVINPPHFNSNHQPRSAAEAAACDLEQERVSKVVDTNMPPIASNSKDVFDQNKRNIRLLKLSEGDLKFYNQNMEQLKKIIADLAYKSEWIDLEKGLNSIHIDEWDQSLWGYALVSAVYRNSFEIMIKRVNLCPEKFRLDLPEWNLAAALICHLNNDSRKAKEFEGRACEFPQLPDYKNKIKSYNNYLVVLKTPTLSFFKQIFDPSEVYDQNPCIFETINYTNGDRYEGEIQNGMPNGNGKYCFQGGDIYIGKFCDGKLNGDGKWVYPNGNYIEGLFCEGDPQGEVDFVFTSQNAHYKGFLKDRLPEGEGWLKYGNGDVYTGEFKDGCRHGKGTLNASSGNVYKGEFFKNLSHGEGEYTYTKDGYCYQGQFVMGQFSGFGQFKYSDGMKFIAIFDKNKPKGNGILISKEGKRQIGYFEGAENRIKKFHVFSDRKKIEHTENEIKRKIESIIVDKFNGKKWDHVEHYLNLTEKDYWSEKVWEIAFLYFIIKNDKEQLKNFYEQSPTITRSLSACNFAVAILKCEKKEYDSALNFLNKARSQYSSQRWFKALESQINEGKEIERQINENRRLASSGSKSDESKPSNIDNSQCSSENKSIKKKRKKQREIVQVPVSESLKVEDKAPVGAKSDDSLVLTVHDETDVGSILNDLVKRLPIKFMEERSKGSHKTLIYTVNGTEFVVPFYTLHGNQEKYAPGTAKEIGAALGRLQTAAEEYSKMLVEQDKKSGLSREELKPITSQEIMQIAMRSNRGAAKVASFAQKLKGVFKK